MANLSNVIEMTLVLLMLVVLFKFTRYLKKTSESDTEKQEYIKKIEKEDAKLRKEVEALESKLRDTFQDSVTHSLSWPLFEDRIQQSLKESERHHMEVALLYVDIDGFNTINSALGREVGDQVLEEVSERLARCIRQVDSASRFSKDTFVLLLTQLKKPETIAVVAQRVMDAMKEPIILNDHELSLTVCIGIAVSPADAKTVSALMQCANHALYLAKKNGPQSHQFYHERMQESSKRELQIATGLRADISLDNFTVGYKVILNAQKQSLFCLDAVLRWDHPEAGLISSSEIFEYASKQRKLDTIVEWLLRRVAYEYSAWQNQGVDIAHISIPLPASLLENSQFIYNISKHLQETSFPPEKLILEIDGNFTQLSLDVLEKAINMLRYLKVRLSVVNFGSDSLSLRQLKRLRPDYLKLEPALIDGVVKEVETQSLLSAIKTLAESLSSKLILVGVNSVDQVDALKRLNFEFINDALQSSDLTAGEVLNQYNSSSIKE